MIDGNRLFTKFCEVNLLCLDKYLKSNPPNSSDHFIPLTAKELVLQRYGYSCSAIVEKYF